MSGKRYGVIVVVREPNVQLVPSVIAVILAVALSVFWLNPVPAAPPVLTHGVRVTDCPAGVVALLGNNAWCTRVLRVQMFGTWVGLRSAWSRV